MEALSLFGRLADDKRTIEAQTFEPSRKAVVRGAKASGRRAAWVALDVEATGGSAADRIIQIAIVPFSSNGEPMRGEDGQSLAWWSYVNPEGRMSNMHALQVHQITSAQTRTAPRFRELARKIWRLLAERVVVGHNLSYDLRMLAAEFERLEALSPRERERLRLDDEDYHLTPPMREICTQTLVRQWYKTQGAKKPKVGLKDACAALGVCLTRHHDALYDAEAAGRLYGNLMGWRERDPALAHMMPPADADADSMAELRRAEIERAELEAQRAREAEAQRALEARLAEEAREPLEGRYALTREVRLRERVCSSGGHEERREVVYPPGTPVELLSRGGRGWEVRIPASPEPRLARWVGADAVREVRP